MTGKREGKQSERLKEAEKAIQNAEKKNQVLVDNLRKSDAALLNELLKRDTRKEP